MAPSACLLARSNGPSKGAGCFCLAHPVAGLAKAWVLTPLTFLARHPRGCVFFLLWDDPLWPLLPCPRQSSQSLSTISRPHAAHVVRHNVSHCRSKCGGRPPSPSDSNGKFRLSVSQRNCGCSTAAPNMGHMARHPYPPLVMQGGVGGSHQRGTVHCDATMGYVSHSLSPPTCLPLPTSLPPFLCALGAHGVRPSVPRNKYEYPPPQTAS